MNIYRLDYDRYILNDKSIIAPRCAISGDIERDSFSDAAAADHHYFYYRLRILHNIFFTKKYTKEKKSYNAIDLRKQLNHISFH